MIIQQPEEITTLAKQFTISDPSKIFHLLTTKLYSDPMTAFMRELIANAIDVCIENSLPVKYTVDITNELFTIRDYGTGLHKEELTGFYTSLGYSSKTTSNKLIGGFGIGRLSPLSYTESFAIESYYEGFVTNATVSIKTGIPTLAINRHTITDEPNGLKVVIQVNRSYDRGLTPQDYLDNVLKYIHHKPMHYDKPIMPFDLTATVTFIPRYSQDPLRVWIDGMVYDTDYSIDAFKDIEQRVFLYRYRDYIIKLANTEKIEITPSRTKIKSNAYVFNTIKNALDTFIQTQLTQLATLYSPDKTIKEMLIQIRAIYDMLNFTDAPIHRFYDPRFTRYVDSIVIPESLQVKEEWTSNPIAKKLNIAYEYEVRNDKKVTRRPQPFVSLLEQRDITVFIKDSNKRWVANASNYVVLPQEFIELNNKYKLINTDEYTLTSSMPLAPATKAKPSINRRTLIIQDTPYSTPESVTETLLDTFTGTSSYVYFGDKLVRELDDVITSLSLLRLTGLIDSNAKIYKIAEGHRKKLQHIDSLLEITEDPASISRHIPNLTVYSQEASHPILHSLYKQLMNMNPSEHLKIVLNSLLLADPRMKFIEVQVIRDEYRLLPLISPILINIVATLPLDVLGLMHTLEQLIEYTIRLKTI
jgi:hypothetical protein